MDSITDQSQPPAAPKPLPSLGAAGPVVGRDRESRDRIVGLTADDPVRELAVAALHDLLLGAARFEVGRPCASSPSLREQDHDELARASADHALAAVLGGLEDFPARSRFTTWAYKFAISDAAARVRRRAWLGREVASDPDRWSFAGGHCPVPEGNASAEALLAVVHDAIENDLSPHQRDVLVAVTLRPRSHRRSR